MRTLAIFMTAALLGLASHAAAATTLYVAADGNDANPGTADRPFATLERARDEIRQRKAAVGLAEDGFTVELRGGTYQRSQPLQLTAKDSGTPSTPIIYRVSRGETVRLVGGREVTGWEPVADAAALARLDESARGQVWQADLKVQGITDLEGIGAAKSYQSDPGLEVFFQEKPMTLARYPNSGYMFIARALDASGQPGTGIVTSPEGKFVCEDPRPARWTKEKDVWLHGFWAYDWSDLRIPLCSVDPEARTLSLGPRAGQSFRVRAGQWFYAQNVLSELDSPGEWYLDRDTATLYFWPPAPLSAGKVVVSLVRDLVQLDGACHVAFRGLLFEAGRGSAMVVKGGADVRVVACTIRNMGNWAVKVYGGTRHGVVGCDIYQTGQGGVHLEGGDRKTLTPASHYADNNHIHHTARWDPVYQQAITVFGVGNRATHNLIENVPHIAIGFTGNDQTIEYNEIHSSVFQSNDAGAIYTSPPDETWSMRGHKIRYNYLHNIHGFQGKGCQGVYLDDCFSSADISGNIFYDVATAILIGGGRDNLMTNNLFIKCGHAFSIDARGLGWAKAVGTFATKELIELNYRQPPWSVKYPELLGILEDEPLAPKGNVMARNICWGGPWGRTQAEALPLVKFEDNLIDVDPRFAGTPPADFRLADNSPAHKFGFQSIPLDKIGVYPSEDRASWPVEHSLRP
ncbi:MAG: right-handed parallel beta-helix repeat-containing protein [Rhodopirellula sp.]|nr:right-handed parallel beta-helix repeat-containing protein [Rhodopirellula sp.]